MSAEEVNAHELLKQFLITDEDLDLIRKFSTKPEVDVQKLIDDFYAWLENQVWYSQYFSSGVPPKVQSLQRDYWQVFLNAQVDDAYVKQRVRVGRVHATINLPVTAYLAGMNFAQNWFAEQAALRTKNVSERMALLVAINKLIQLDSNIVMHMYSMQSMDAVRLQGELTRKIVSEATRVVSLAAEGDFDTHYISQDDGDALESPINQMIANLKRFSEENEKEKWLKSGLADISFNMRGGLSIDKLCDNAIGFLAPYLGAQVGVLYVANDDGSAALSASYAFTRRKNLDNRIQPGEGLVGQVLKERKPILLSNVPQDYITISSGLGEHVPRNVVVQPLMYENKIKGAIELGSFYEFTNDQLEFLLQVGESIAIAINSAQDQEKMKQLLEEAQQTSEKLQYQQDELETVNKTLEDQAQALKQSEEELTAQRDMLEESNKELQIKTDYLERQTSEIEKARFELEEKANQLANSSKYKSEFLANMSHELRTPLNSLLLLSQTMMANKEGNLNEVQIEDLRVIYSGGQALLTLINDILDLSKIEAGKMHLTNEKFDLVQLLNDLQSQFKAVSSDKKLEFNVHVDEAIDSEIYTDRQRLEQILRNLLSNAFKFTHSGSVSLAITNGSDDKVVSGKVKNATNSNATNKLGWLNFVVSDTGIGMSPANQSIIFEAFQQADGSTSRAYGGTGLGLTISRELATLLGGKIALESEEGVGSTFTLTVPFSRNAGDHNSENKTPSIGGSRSDIGLSQVKDVENTNHILIVENDEAFCKIVSDAARKYGLTPVVASTGMAALNLVLSHNPKAVIINMGLPDSDGLKVLESLKASPHTRHIPIHLVSDQEKDRELLKKGALGFCSKPATEEELDQVFSRFETLIQKDIKQILIVEDDAATVSFIERFLQDRNVEMHSAGEGKTAIEILRQQRIDCCILDLGLADMSGYKFLDEIDADPTLSIPPIIVYTAQDLTESDYKKLRKYTDKVILKDGRSPERLQDELELFLHSVKEKGIPTIKNGENVGIETDCLAGRKVLLVDDDLRNVYALSKVLKDNGLIVTLADNGQLALDKLYKDKNVDLILMDIMMPVMDGYEAMREIRSHISTSIPIIALTAKAMSEDREKCISAGANDYMAKPVDVENLLSMVKVWCYH